MIESLLVGLRQLSNSFHLESAEEKILKTNTITARQSYEIVIVMSTGG